MSPKLSKKLAVAYPVLFGQDSTSKIIGYPFYKDGFLVGDGWFKVIFELAHYLEKYNDTDPAVPVVCVQVKEKWGSMRFIVNKIPPGATNLVEAAEVATTKICESCGNDGVLVQVSDWYKTLCTDCHFDIEST